MFGALFAIGLRHIRRVCSDEGWAHHCSGSLVGRLDEVLPLGWADDLAIMSDFESPTALQQCFPRVAVVALSTLRHLRFRVNLGPGKTEAMLHIRGARAKEVRGVMLGHDPCLPLPTGDILRLTPEYRYLGVVLTPKDTGHRDAELCSQRAQTAWAHARGLIASPSLPWALKQAWFAGRVLPAAYATLATNIAVSHRASAPLSGLFERAARHLLQTWQVGHFVTRPVLLILTGQSAPEHAVIIARVRLVMQLLEKAPPAVWDLFDAAWNRATPWCSLLADACRQFLPASVTKTGPECPTALLLPCRKFGTHLSRLHAFLVAGALRRLHAVTCGRMLLCPVRSASLVSCNPALALCARLFCPANMLSLLTSTGNIQSLIAIPNLPTGRSVFGAIPRCTRLIGLSTTCGQTPRASEVYEFRSVKYTLTALVLSALAVGGISAYPRSGCQGHVMPHLHSVRRP